jgi:hypothetical protein
VQRRADPLVHMCPCLPQAKSEHLLFSFWLSPSFMQAGAEVEHVVSDKELKRTKRKLPQSMRVVVTMENVEL